MLKIIWQILLVMKQSEETIVSENINFRNLDILLSNKI